MAGRFFGNVFWAAGSISYLIVIRRAAYPVGSGKARRGSLRDLAARRNEWLERRNELRQVVLNDSPDDVETDFVAGVDEAMAHVGDIAPGKVGMSGGELSRNFPGRLANDFKRSDDCILMQSARFEGCEVHALHEALGVIGSQDDVKDEGVVTRHRSVLPGQGCCAGE